MVLKKNHRPKRGNSTAKLLIVLTVLLIIGFGGGTWYVQAKNKEVNSKRQISLVDQTATILNLDQSTWSKLRDSSNLFEVKFPKNIFKRTSKQITSPLLSKEKFKTVGLVHLVSTESCGNSGSSFCSPTTTDIAIDFFAVPRNFNDVFTDLQKSYGQNMPVVTIDGHQGVRFRLGSEKQGIIYTVLPISNDKTLFIMRSYLSEELNVIYKKTPEFISLSEQKALFDQIISTFTFRPTI